MKAIKKAANGTTTTQTTTPPKVNSYSDPKEKKLPKPVSMLPYKAEVPGSFRPYTNKQKDSIINSWETKLKKESGKLLNNKNGGTVKAKDGKWIQKATASIKRRGTEGKCTPITKPGCTGKARTLAKTFKAIAKKKKNK